MFVFLTRGKSNVTIGNCRKTKDLLLGHARILELNQLDLCLSEDRAAGPPWHMRLTYLGRQYSIYVSCSPSLSIGPCVLAGYTVIFGTAGRGRGPCD